MLEEIQQNLIEMGLLDPPADGVIGPVTSWALKAAGIKDTVTAEHAEDILRRLKEKKALALNPGNDFAGRIIKAMERNKYWVQCHHSCVNIVYIEGMNPDGKPNKNVPNHFNDLRLLIRVEHGGVPKIVGKWEATTEPGKYWTEKPMNKNGAARIKFGQWKCWSRGVHNKHHEALVQTRELEVFRDPQKRYQRYGSTFRGLFGINQHHGYDLRVHDLARSSAGCLVGRTTAGHSAFMRLVKDDARFKASGGSYRFMTTVMPAAQIVA